MPAEPSASHLPSPLPVRAKDEADAGRERRTPEASDSPKCLAPHARLRIHLDDLTHPAAGRFASVIPLSKLLQEAITNVEKHLFTPKPHQHGTAARATPPPQQQVSPPLWEAQEVRSVTLVIRSFDGVAYTEGSKLDEAHKEIHFSLKHIANQQGKSDADYLHEIRGVVTHEMVHAFQHNARGSCPGGLIEGIADYVRIRSGLGAQHWRKWPANEKSRGTQWDQGYERTAWFLEWVEAQCEGKTRHAIGVLNHAMQGRKWDEGKLFEEVTGKTVEEWWELYRAAWEKMNEEQ